MTRLSESDEGIEWIKQLRVNDQSLATILMDAITLVSHDQFVANLRQRIIDQTTTIAGQVALYAEREIRRGKNKIPNRLYKEPYRKKNRRAYGMGPQPVKPTRNYDLTVGSEGIISWLISDLCTEFPEKFFSHPSPYQIREKRIRKFLLVTDLIGSGKRALEYLESAWRVASIRSWKSLKYWSFGVIAYSGTDAGIKRVKRHKATPTVDLVVPCPTIYSEFDENTLEKMKLLCIKYDPVDQDKTDSLGYEGTGALIVFSHGCPNNLPRIFHKQKDNVWNPLFLKRKTAGTRHIFGEKDNEYELKKRFNRLHELRLAKGFWIPKMSKEGKKMLLVLAALRRGPRFTETIARKTGLTIPEVEIILEKAKEWGWISENRYLTKAGCGQLSHARQFLDPNDEVKIENDRLYFPKSLRAPKNASS